MSKIINVMKKDFVQEKIDWIVLTVLIIYFSVYFKEVAQNKYFIFDNFHESVSCCF